MHIQGNLQKHSLAALHTQLSESHRERLRSEETERRQNLAAMQQAADERQASLRADLASIEKMLQSQVRAGICLSASAYPDLYHTLGTLYTRVQWEAWV